MSAASIKRATQLIEENQFLMLSKSWCPDCHYTYSIWKKYGVFDKIKIIELDKFENQKEALDLELAFTKISGRKWVPTIFFNKQRFGTEEDLKKLESLDQTEQVFRKAGLL